MSHNRKMTPDEAETVREFALFIRLAAQANDLQASLYQRALLKAQMDLTAALIDAAKPNTEHKRKRTRKRRSLEAAGGIEILICASIACVRGPATLLVYCGPLDPS